jgi:hypothetical protein
LRLRFRWLHLATIRLNRGSVRAYRDGGRLSASRADLRLNRLAGSLSTGWRAVAWSTRCCSGSAKRFLDGIVWRCCSSRSRVRVRSSGKTCHVEAGEGCSLPKTILHTPDVLTTRSSASRWRLLGFERAGATDEGIPAARSTTPARRLAASGRGRGAPLTGLLAALPRNSGAGSATSARGLHLSGVNECPLVVVIAPVVQPDGLVLALAHDTDQARDTASQWCSAPARALRRRSGG